MIAPLHTGRKARILFVQSDVRAHGGRTAVFAWMLEALRADCELTVFTWKPVDVPALNAQYGTAVPTTDVGFLRPSWVMRWCAAFIDALDTDPGSIQRVLLLARAARWHATSFDLIIGCEMESDWGIPGLQYIHYPWLARFYPRYAAVNRDSPNRKLLAVLQGRARPWQWTGDFSFGRMRSNMTLTNSDWTGERVRAAYDVTAVTLYPPATIVAEAVPWTSRANGFLVLGRIHPDKRLDWIIDALAPLRSEIPVMHLHLVGSAGAQEQDYSATLQPLLAEHASWVTLHLNLSRAELSNLAVRQRYGVHAMVDEHFGMAVAEMVCAGQIPFVHRSGGVVEIVNDAPELLYSSAEELRARVLAVTGSTESQDRLRRKLGQSSERFSSERFQREFREAVSNCMGRAGE